MEYLTVQWIDLQLRQNMFDSSSQIFFIMNTTNEIFNSKYWKQSGCCTRDDEDG